MTMNLDQKMLQNCQEELRQARDEIHRLKRPKMVKEPPFDRRDIVGMARDMCDEISGKCDENGEYARGSIEIVTVLMDEVSRLRHQHANDECANRMLLTGMEVQNETLSALESHRNMLLKELKRLYEALEQTDTLSPEGRAELDMIEKAINHDVC